MTNEIKEILDYLKDKDNYIEELGIAYKRIFITNGDLKTLLDYITNLQNEIFDLKDTIQNKNDCIGAYECIIEDRDKRIDKAVEYINKYEYEKYCSGPYEKDKYIMREEKEGQDLLNILRGEE